MRCAFSIFLLLAIHVSMGQSTHTLHVTCSDKPATFFTGKYGYKTLLKDSSAAAEEVKGLYYKLRTAGYQAVSVDSVRADSLTTHLYMYVGERSDYLMLRNGNVDGSLLANTGLKNVVSGSRKIPIEQRKFDLW